MSDEKFVFSKYSKVKLPPPNKYSGQKIKLDSDQSDYFFDCYSKLQGILSVFEIFGYACSNMDSYVGMDIHLEFSRHLENSFNFLTSGMDEVLYDLLDLIDY